MNLMLCMGKDGEMLFNKRRVVTDIDVRENIVESSMPKMLYMSNYSADLFSKDFPEYCFDIKNIESVPDGDWYFCEDPDEITDEILERTNKVITYTWENNYPKDKAFDMTRLNEFLLTERENIKEDKALNNGKFIEQEKIIKRTYVRR